MHRRDVTLMKAYSINSTNPQSFQTFFRNFAQMSAMPMKWDCALPGPKKAMDHATVLCYSNISVTDK
jgi:hypothetical protein